VLSLALENNGKELFVNVFQWRENPKGYNSFKIKGVGWGVGVGRNIHIYI